MLNKILVSCAFLLSFTTLSIADELDKQKEQMFDPVVQINDNCSGVVVYSRETKSEGNTVDIDTFVLTAKHCTAKFGVGEVVTVKHEEYGSDGELGAKQTYYYGNVVLKAPNNDFALISLKDHKTKFKEAKVADNSMIEKMRFGQEVWAVGYPLGMSLTVTEGKLGNIEYIPQLPQMPSGEEMSLDGAFQRSTADINPGSSGGPLFTKDENGDYVIIGTASLMGPASFVAYYTTLKSLKEFINIPVEEQNGTNTNK